MKVVDKKRAFNLRRYTYTPREACPVRAKTLLIIVAPTLFPNKLDSATRVVAYNLQLVLRQDQGAVWILGKIISSSVLVAEGKTVGEGHHQILANAVRLFCPGLPRAGVKLPRGVFLCQNYVGSSFLFVAKKEDPH